MDDFPYSVLGVITARGGSKGIPGKNTKLLGGTPLIAYSIAAAKKSVHITDTIVSTDSPEIAAIAEACGGSVPFMRPAHLAEDTTEHLPVLQHALEEMEQRTGKRYDYIVTLQPTSPFRLPEDIDKTIERIVETGADSAVTVYALPSSMHPMKAKRVEDGILAPYCCLDEPEGIRRQDLPLVYRRSAAVYVSRRETIMNDRFYGDKLAAHVVPADRSIDIDTPLDWAVAEHMLTDLTERGVLL